MEIFGSEVLKEQHKMFKGKVVLILNTAELNHIRDRLEEIMGDYEKASLAETVKRLEES
jgi:hypothetical protein